MMKVFTCFFLTMSLAAAVFTKDETDVELRDSDESDSDGESLESLSSNESKGFQDYALKYIEFLEAARIPEYLLFDITWLCHRYEERLNHFKMFNHVHPEYGLCDID